MRQSKLFTKTRKNPPTDEVAKNAQLLIRAGYVHKEMAGTYAYLPLGLRVLKKIEQVIREEMNKIGGQEIEMTVLQEPGLWQKTNRWSDDEVDNWFKTNLSSGAELGLGFTHEEPITNMLLDHVSSYRDLPLYVYQFQNKFRNELRAKSGLMRGREFLMKDMYSFSQSEEEFEKFYESCAAAYHKIFKRCGLGELTFRTKAAGGSFTNKFTDEFQTISNSGEDLIYLDRKNNIAINKEIYNDELAESLGLEVDNLEQVKSIEVGNIFPLGTKFSSAMGLGFLNQSGESEYPVMGSYGIGVGRLMGTVVEVLSDDRGIVWPDSIAPFAVHILQIGDSDTVIDAAHELYNDLLNQGLEVLLDDRDLSPGQKFADSDLIGIPNRIIVSEKSLKSGGYEFKRRDSDEAQIIDVAEIKKQLCSDN